MTCAPGFRIRFAVLNLRMGGQVSSLASLAEALQTRGLPVEFVLPEGVPAPTKEALDSFARLSFLTRLRRTWRMLRALPRGRDQVLHLVLPSPAFAFLCPLLRVPCARILVQSEGPPTAWDRGHIRDFMEAPGFMLPRMVLNHQWLVRLAQLVPVAHLVPSPRMARWMRDHRFEEVACVANIASLKAGEEPTGAVCNPLPFGAADLLVGYIGHAHRVKGVDDLLDAFEAVQPERPELALLLAFSGDGDPGRFRRRIQAMAPGIRARIHMAGLVPIQRVLARLDALLLPYRSLASTTLYPSLLLEADLARCPVVLSDLPDLADVVDPSSSLLHRVPPRAPEAIGRVLLDLPRRGERQAGGRLLVLPDEAVRVDLLAQAYQDLCQRP